MPNQNALQSLFLNLPDCWKIEFAAFNNYRHYLIIGIDLLYQSQTEEVLMKFAVLMVALYSFVSAANPYPDTWWTPVLDKNVPSWEILPQSAAREKNEVILSKRNELGILSNFAAAPITILGTRYASLEGLWQSMKYPESTSDLRMKILGAWPMKRSEVAALTAFEALKAGKEAEKLMVANKINWVSFSGFKIDYKGNDSEAFYEVIEAATRAKIDQNPEVKKTLLATGDLILKPDHHEDKDGTKAWKYYEIYMKLRGDLKSNPNKKLYNDDWFSNLSKKFKLSKIQ